MWKKTTSTCYEKEMIRRRNNYLIFKKEWTYEDWRKVLFSEESHLLIQELTCLEISWRAGEKMQHWRVCQASRKDDVLGCYSYYGIGLLHPVDRKMRMSQSINVLKRRVSQKWQTLFQMDKRYSSKTLHRAKHQRWWPVFPAEGDKCV